MDTMRRTGAPRCCRPDAARTPPHFPASPLPRADLRCDSRGVIGRLSRQTAMTLSADEEAPLAALWDQPPNAGDPPTADEADALFCANDGHAGRQHRTRHPRPGPTVRWLAGAGGRRRRRPGAATKPPRAVTIALAVALLLSAAALHATQGSREADSVAGTVGADAARHRSPTRASRPSTDAERQTAAAAPVARTPARQQRRVSVRAPRESAGARKRRGLARLRRSSAPSRVSHGAGLAATTAPTTSPRPKPVPAAVVFDQSCEEFPPC